jgi:hypothetical protein
MKKNLQKIVAISMLMGMTASTKSSAAFDDFLANVSIVFLALNEGLKDITDGKGIIKNIRERLSINNSSNGNNSNKEGNVSGSNEKGNIST